jgi:tight adherence protein B
MIIIVTFGIMAVCIPFLVKKVREGKQRLLLASQLRQALQNMVHALHIGVGFQQALEYVAQEAEMPLGAEWRRLLQSVRLGSPWSEALTELGKRVNIPEMGWFVAAVQITQNTGGSLAEVLEILSETLQERQILRDKVSALTAQGKASGFVLAALPFILLAALRVIVPGLVRPMFTTAAGQAMIAAIMVSVAMGGLVIWKIVNIKVDE